MSLLRAHLAMRPRISQRISQRITQRSRRRCGLAAISLTVACVVLTVVLTVVPGAVSTAQAQSGVGPPTTSRATTVPERLPLRVLRELQPLIDSLDAERLPSDALRDKAAEGALKGADDARIVAAVRALAQRLRVARGLLGATAHDDELQAAAGALFAGVPSSTITRLANAHRSRRSTAQTLTVPLSVIAELAASRVPSDVAWSSVDALLSRGAVDADLRLFRLAVDRSIREGRSPRDATVDGMQRTLRGLDRVP